LKASYYELDMALEDQVYREGLNVAREESFQWQVTVQYFKLQQSSC
jgi:hypothetical protein